MPSRLFLAHASLTLRLRMSISIGLVFSLIPGLSLTAMADQAPKPLSKTAKTADWPRFLGPLDRPESPETELLKEFPKEGPKVVWETPTGEGYACPAILGDAIVLFYSKDKQECIERREAATGKLVWTHSYPISYRDKFGYANGPRAGAVIRPGATSKDPTYVYTFGVASNLHCLDLATGKVVWKRDTAAEDQVPQYFFGSGASPIVVGENVILNLGGLPDRCTVAFKAATGEVAWVGKHAWGQSYASPILAKFHGTPHLLVFAGGESEPSTGGLLSFDPTNGTVKDSFPWRASRYASVNASTPVIVPENRVLISQGYTDPDGPHNGAALVEMTKDGKWQEIWKNPAILCHWMTPVYHEGHIYAFVGEKEHGCDLICASAATGEILWREKPEWEQDFNGGTLPMSFRRGSLLRADGHFLCLGEMGTLAWLDLSPKGMKILSKCQPVLAPQTWTLPAISRGLLYLVQSETDLITKAGPRVVCLDLRR